MTHSDPRPCSTETTRLTKPFAALGIILNNMADDTFNYLFDDERVELYTNPANEKVPFD